MYSLRFLNIFQFNKTLVVKSLTFKLIMLELNILYQHQVDSNYLNTFIILLKSFYIIIMEF